MGLDSDHFVYDWNNGEIKKRSRSPSPIKRLEDSIFIATRTNLDNSIYEINSSIGNQFSKKLFEDDQIN